MDQRLPLGEALMGRFPRRRAGCNPLKYLATRSWDVDVWQAWEMRRDDCGICRQAGRPACAMQTS